MFNRNDWLSFALEWQKFLFLLSPLVSTYELSNIQWSDIHPKNSTHTHFYTVQLLHFIATKQNNSDKVKRLLNAMNFQWRMKTQGTSFCISRSSYCCTFFSVMLLARLALKWHFEWCPCNRNASSQFYFDENRMNHLVMMCATKYWNKLNSIHTFERFAFRALIYNGRN